MKVGDLVAVPCTCGKSHGHEPKIAVIVQKDPNGMVQILLEGRRLWVDPIIELEPFNESR